MEQRGPGRSRPDLLSDLQIDAPSYFINKAYVNVFNLVHGIIKIVETHSEVYESVQVGHHGLTDILQSTEFRRTTNSLGIPYVLQETTYYTEPTGEGDM